MVRKITVLIACALLLFSFSCGASAAQYTPYDGNMSSTYTNYFRDIVSGIGFMDNYVAFRSGQNEYILLVGSISYADNTFMLTDKGTMYTITANDGYNGYYTYSVSETDSFSLSADNKIVYSDLGQFPQLTDRGANYEIIQTALLITLMLFILIRRIFGMR